MIYSFTYFLKCSKYTLCLSPLLGAIGDTVEIAKTASALEGFGVWPLRGNTHGREWQPSGFKVCLCVISMHRLLSGPGRWLSRVCKEVAAYSLQSTLKKSAFVRTPNPGPRSWNV